MATSVTPASCEPVRHFGPIADTLLRAARRGHAHQGPRSFDLTTKTGYMVATVRPHAFPLTALALEDGSIYVPEGLISPGSAAGRWDTSLNAGPGTMAGSSVLYWDPRRQCVIRKCSIFPIRFWWLTFRGPGCDDRQTQQAGTR
jgi:hypothetical protein